MEIRYFCSTWGNVETTLEAALRRIQGTGYDGVELGVPDHASECAPLRALLDELGLLLVVQQWTRGSSPEEHAASFAEQYSRAVLLRPLGVNSHTGKDHFTLEQNLAVFARAAECEVAAGIPVWHETHRGRALFSAPATEAFLNARPELKLTADFSHWCCVHESMLEDQAARVVLAAGRTHHLHARIGHSQGPQIPDPRVASARPGMETHLDWWRCIARARRAAGSGVLTVCPEFGPPPYMTLHPVTGEPLADLWSVNLHMRDWLKGQEW